MGWSRFHYWRRGKSVPKVISSKPKSFQGPLIEYQIKQGMYRPSPYLQMVDQEYALLNQEVEKYKIDNPDYNKIDFLGWFRDRKSVYNKRIFKLRDEHWEYDKTRLSMFRNELVKTFGVDVWEKTLEVCEGDEMEFYHQYGKISLNNKI